uniref:Sulfotransferase domain-containing protein n=1 Tax=Aplanochytrium stocchinoi TaxID=215587 RepID=A0A7S3V1Q4_9STRA|mmetsp:Transcript_32299/g.39745  ORF Transcript_32299/g.39745 Transcript_32299/m.39745 type:complete len:578 (+) Transcript_32299:194-1927(+)
MKRKMAAGPKDGSWTKMGTGRTSAKEVNEKRKRRSTLLLFLLLLLLGLVYYYWYSQPQVIVQEEAHTEPPGPIQKPILEKENWVAVNQYDVLKKRCYVGYTLMKVNNRRGDHDACFGACLGWNMDRPDEPCIGWTTRLIHNTHTCYLKSKLEDVTIDINCASGKMWKSALEEMLEGANSQGFTEEYEVNNEDEESAEDGNVDNVQDISSTNSSGTLFENEMEKSTENGKNDGGDENKPDEPAENTGNSNANAENENVDVADALKPFEKPICSLDGKGKTEKEGNRVMRVFIAAAQASGSTLLAYLMGQNEDSAAVLDMGVRQNMPALSYFEKATRDPKIKDIVVKASIRGISHTPKVWIKHIQQQYNPDYSILFLRNPIDTMLHLLTHIGVGTKTVPSEAKFRSCDKSDFQEFSYGLRCGTPAGKLKALNDLFKNAESDFQRVITYEDLCLNRTLVVRHLNEDGYCIPLYSFNQPKYSIIDVMKKGFYYFPSSHDPKGLFWGAGHLMNSFHHKKTGEVHSESHAFGECPGIPGEETREQMMKEVGSPYSDWTLQQIRDLAIESAPDIAKYYSDRGML